MVIVGGGPWAELRWSYENLRNSRKLSLFMDEGPTFLQFANESQKTGKLQYAITFIKEQHVSSKQQYATNISQKIQTTSVTTSSFVT